MLDWLNLLINRDMPDNVLRRQEWHRVIWFPPLLTLSQAQLVHPDPIPCWFKPFLHHESQTDGSIAWTAAWRQQQLHEIWLKGALWASLMSHYRSQTIQLVRPPLQWKQGFARHQEAKGGGNIWSLEVTAEQKRLFTCSSCIKTLSKELMYNDQVFL